MIRRPVVHSGYKIDKSTLSDFFVLERVVREEENTHEDVEHRKHYWRNTFLFLLVPFVSIGLPLHLILPTEKTKMMPKAQQSCRQWFRFRFRSIESSIATLVLFLIYLMWNYNFLVNVSTIVNMLVIQGLIEASITNTALQVLYLFPFFIMVNYVWLYGHTLNPLVEYFDAPNVSNTGINKGLGEIVKFRQEFKEGSENVKIWSNDQLHRLPVVKAYVASISAHGLHIAIIRHQSEKEHWTSEQSMEYLMTFVKFVGYVAILPVYIGICRAIRSKVSAITDYIRTCTIAKRRTKQNLYLIKTAYDKIADSILITNYLFSYYLPLVGVVIFVWATMNVLEIMTTASVEILVEYFNVITANFMNIVAAGRSDDSESDSTGTTGVRDPTDIGDLNLSTPSSQKTDAPGFDMSPEDVRYLIGLGLMILLYLYVAFLSVQEALATNDEVRYIHIWLNELAIERGCSNKGCSDRNLDREDEEEFARQFSFLKYYLHSLMESQAVHQRALLCIRGVGYFSKEFGRRMNSYTIAH